MILHEIREYRDVITIVCSNKKGYLSLDFVFIIYKTQGSIAP